MAEAYYPWIPTVLSKSLFAYAFYFFYINVLFLVIIIGLKLVSKDYVNVSILSIEFIRSPIFIAGEVLIGAITFVLKNYIERKDMVMKTN